MSENHTRYSVDNSVLLFSIIQQVARILLMGMKCATVFGLGYCIYLSVDALAGKATDAQIAILISYLSKPDSNGWVIGASSLFGVLGLLFGYLQYRLRRRTIADFSAYRNRVEGPDRTSSMLNEYGQTNQRDR